MALKKVGKIAATLSGEVLVEKIIGDLYELAKKTAGQKIKVWYVKKSAKKLKGHIHKIRQVKTLWQVDKAVDLKQFYCDSHLIIDDKRKMVKSIDDLGDRKHILINGIAGQGKSILLRYLCSDAFQSGKNLPVFIELRRILPGENLIDHIQEFFEIIGITKLDEQILKILFDTGKIILLLDGFDEVSEAEKPKMIREIEQLALVHDNLRMIITSRPESGIEVSPILEVIRLSDLQNGEYKTVIRKLSVDNAFADNLIKQVEAHKSSIDELLCTPLLVTLLVMSYKSYQELPEQLSEFYDSIFQVLLQRHDGVKPGFKRPRRCPFNDNQYRSVFESLCFESKKKSKSIFTYEDICYFATNALKQYNLKVDADKYIDDIIKVTCLILKEGKDYRFIHKSVQEYYLAAFIKHRSEPIAKSFYEQLIKFGPYGSWSQELQFLSEIDKYRFNKYFFLPYLCSIVRCSVEKLPDSVPLVDAEHLKSIIGNLQLGFFPYAKNPSTIAFFSWNQFVSSKQIDRFFQLSFVEVIESIKDGKLIPSKKPNKELFKPELSVSILSINEILDANLMYHEFKIIAQEIVNEAFVKAQNVLDFLNHEESVDINLEINL